MVMDCVSAAGNNFWLTHVSEKIHDHMQSQVKALKAEQLLKIPVQATEQAKIYAASTTKDAELYFNGERDQSDANILGNKRKIEDDLFDNVDNEDASVTDGLKAQPSAANAGTTLIRSSLDLKSILQKYCAKKTTLYDPAHSFILDLSQSSKIHSEFSHKLWAKSVSNKPDTTRKTYHHEIEPFIEHLFGKTEQRRLSMGFITSSPKVVRPPLYFCPRIQQRALICKKGLGEDPTLGPASNMTISRCVRALSQKNNSNIYDFTLMSFVLHQQGGRFLPWHRNRNKDVHIEKVERVQMVDLLCVYEKYEVACALVCGGPHAYNITKIASDEFDLPRIMKDMLDDLQSKFLYAGWDGTQLYILGVQIYMTEVRIYLMEKREIYRLHLLKSFNLPLTFSAYRNLRVALKWAWNFSDDDHRFKIPIGAPKNDMKTKETPTKNLRGQAYEGNLERYFSYPSTF
ncbi:hypothetical protein G9A89_002217 [Geosiphon pyriformis]|nr:hypothetical protein G9A89_002217 [Geosiphon pyriformis]